MFLKNFSSCTIKPLLQVENVFKMQTIISAEEYIINTNEHTTNFNLFLKSTMKKHVVTLFGYLVTGKTLAKQLNFQYLHRDSF